MLSFFVLLNDLLVVLIYLFSSCRDLSARTSAVGRYFFRRFNQSNHLGVEGHDDLQVFRHALEQEARHHEVVRAVDADRRANLVVSGGLHATSCNTVWKEGRKEGQSRDERGDTA